MTVAVGDPFDLQLSASPTTGYCWELASPPPEVQLLGGRVEVPPATPIGGSGIQVFHLKVNKAGRFELHFRLKRRWESTWIDTRVIEVEAR